MKKMRVALAVALFAAISLSVVVSASSSGLLPWLGATGGTVTISKAEYERLQQYAEMDTILQYIEAYYYEEPDTGAMIENATRALLYALEDPYTFYYNQQEYSDLWADDEGEYAGIGIQILGSYEDYSVTITRIFKETPAQAAGLRRGDVLVLVEDLEVNAYTMQEAVNIMRGQAGEAVHVEVLRGEERLAFDIPRAQIKVNRVESAMLANDIGYIVLYEFAGDCTTAYESALNALIEQGAQAIITDLRDNGGGWVDDAQAIADLYLDEHMIAYAEDRFGNREEFFTQDGKTDIPLVLLVNEHTASSSEILAGALKDFGRATIVGTTTYGKGVIQSVQPLQSGAGIQYTYAQYFTPLGHQVHEKGIAPDVEAALPEELLGTYYDLGDMADPQLNAAWEEAVKLTQSGADGLAAALR